MASITVTDREVSIRFTRFERIAGLIRDHAVPVSAVDRVALVTEPMREPRGWRTGYALPRHALIGTWRRRGRRELVCVRPAPPAVRLDLHGDRYDACIISVEDAADVVERIRLAIGRTGP